MKRLASFACLFLLWSLPEHASPADAVPGAIQQPGTQPQEVNTLESPNKCDNCHGGYNSAVEPAHNWRGSMMAHAGRDPIFWATMAVAEQDFDGAGDLCLRCHSTGGWLAGRSTPTDGSGLAAGDSDGVECDYCHKLTNPDDSDPFLQGVMNAPFIANCDGLPQANCQSATEGFFGSGMSSMWGASDKLGPYIDADARHQFMQSNFHRDVDFCGTCHDVSNPITGDVAHNFGQLVADTNVNGSGNLDSSLDQKSAFRYPPYRYGVVERTFSEYKSGEISKTLVDEYPEKLAPESEEEEGKLAGGALQAIYDATYNLDRDTANYEDGTPRYYSCQTCHMRAVAGTGANKRGVPFRTDLPLHDMTGGNYWMADAIEYLDTQGKLRLGGGMSQAQIQAMQNGALRAKEQLRLAATLEVDDNEVRVVNHTGHKLITGYPEGRRMWLNIKWFDGTGEIEGTEIGAYGPIQATVDHPRTGKSVQVESIQNLEGSDTVIYEAHMGMTQEWAHQLLSLLSPDLVLSYNRDTGAPDMTLGDLAHSEPGTIHETFHFALNNTVIRDNRIPPFMMDVAEAKRRNASPVPKTADDAYPKYTVDANEYFEHFDEVSLAPPAGATYATIDLLYQPTSWEYIQFLYLANKGNNAFLANEGANILEAWLETEMAKPFVMASATWHATAGDPDPEPDCNAVTPTLMTAEAQDKAVTLSWTEAEASVYRLYHDQSDKAQLVAELDCAVGECLSYTHTGLTNGQSYCYKVTAVESDICESTFSNTLCATPQNQGQTAQLASVAISEAGVWTGGKGKHATQELTFPQQIVAGDEVGMSLAVSNQTVGAVSGAVVHVTITGPVTIELTSSTSDATGDAELHWNTQAPKRNGSGGTPPGDYTARVTGLSSNAYDWDGNWAATDFVIQPMN